MPNGASVPVAWHHSSALQGNFSSFCFDQERRRLQTFSPLIDQFLKVYVFLTFLYLPFGYGVFVQEEDTIKIRALPYKSLIIRTNDGLLDIFVSAEYINIISRTGNRLHVFFLMDHVCFHDISCNMIFPIISWTYWRGNHVQFESFQSLAFKWAASPLCLGLPKFLVLSFPDAKLCTKVVVSQKLFSRWFAWASWWPTRPSSLVKMMNTRPSLKVWAFKLKEPTSANVRCEDGKNMDVRVFAWWRHGSGGSVGGEGGGDGGKGGEEGGGIPQSVSPSRDGTKGNEVWTSGCKEGTGVAKAGMCRSRERS